MKRILSLLAGAGISCSAWAQDFEAPGFPLNAAVDHMGGWRGEGAITGEEFAHGSQSLEIPAGATASLALKRDAGVRFVDLQILPVVADGAALRIGGIALGFGKADGAGQLMIVTPDGAESVAGARFALVEGTDLAATWQRVTVRIDVGTGKWDVFWNGQMVLADRPGAGAAEALEAAAPAAGALYLDQVAEGSSNPLFEDTDGDGIPDAEEKAFGLDPSVNDRDGDLDHDGISNLREILDGTPPNVAAGSAGGSLHYLYVDNLRGSDGNAGLHAYPAAGSSGPKATIKAAMAAARHGDVIVVLRGSGIYREGSRGAPGKDLTIKAVEPVIIQ